MRRFFAAVLLLTSIPAGIPAQEPASNQAYISPPDPLVAEKLEAWQDLKFGLLMHWGLYAQLGIVESWALCSEDQPFQDRGGVPYEEFKRMYFGLIEEFNPRQFDPEPWATAAWDAGMRYVVFTTKHHDGFSMWDTKETDFRITGPESPFRDHPRSNVAKEIFEAFRQRGFMTGAYFSKADWHHPDYWSPLWATPNRNNNYDTRKYPEKWQSFRDFTYRQVEELMTTMGPMDILWLDAGWVRPDSTINDEVRSWGFDIARWEQDIDMPRIVAMAREHQPGLIVVDRTVHGPYENYRTPEQRVPDSLLPYPWETNLTMTQSWGHTFQPRYKSARDLIHTLVEVVSKGGNFLLNVAPTPEGTFEDDAFERLSEIGRWMAVNGEAIYGTRPVPELPPQPSLRYTRAKEGGTVFVFAMEWPGSSLRLRGFDVPDGSRITLLGGQEPLDWSRDSSGLLIHLSERMREASEHVWTFRIEGAGSN